MARDPKEPKYKVEDLGEAEAVLLEKARLGEDARLKDKSIRADFLRDLCVHADLYEIHEKGVRLTGATIAETLNFEAAALPRPLQLASCVLKKELILMDAETRMLSLQGTTIDGDLTGDRLTVRGGLILDGVTVKHEARLLGARITGDLDCDGATFGDPEAKRPPGTKAFSADSITVDGDMFFRNVKAHGATRLLGARITGNLACDGTTFGDPEADKAPEAPAFSADGITVDGDMFLRNVKAHGATRLPGAHITGDLSCHGATFANLGDDAFSAERMTVKERLFWCASDKTPISIKGNLSLRHARIGDLVDDGSGWPEAKKLHIDGFVYDNLVNPTSAEERLRWLALMPKTWKNMPAYWPQPYEQLIKVFRRAGHEHDARMVAIAKQDAYLDYLRRKAAFNPKEKRLWRRGWMHLIRLLNSYGHEPWRVFFTIIYAVLFGWMIHSNAYHEGYMLPSKERVYLEECYKTGCAKWGDYERKWFKQPLHLPAEYPEFNSFIYAVDTFVPIVDLHQETYWSPKGDGISGGFFRLYLWLHIALGWFLTTIAVVGFTGLIKKSEKSDD